MSHFFLKDEVYKVMDELNKIEGSQHLKNLMFLLCFKVGKVGEEHHVQSTADSFAAKCSCNIPSYVMVMLYVMDIQE